MPFLLTALALAASLTASDPAFESELATWREQRAQSLTREESWTSLVGLHWLDAGQRTSIGSMADNGIVIAGLPETLGEISRVNGVWRIALAPDVSAVVDGEPTEHRVTLTSDQAAAAVKAAPTKVAYGNIRFILIERGERFALRVWDIEAATRTGFAGLDYFPADPDWRIRAQWQAHQPPRSIDIATVINTVEPMANPGAAVFERNGKTYRLEALAEAGSEQLFFILADRTSGKTTYGAGRYLYTALPDAEGTVTLDFNRAYNPPCAFSPYATCPLPPPENRLDLLVEAGEKKYRGGPAH